MLDHHQLSSAGGASLSALHLSLLSDTTSTASWLDRTPDNLLKDSSTSSTSLFEDSIYRSFLKSQGAANLVEDLNTIDESIFEDTSSFVMGGASNASPSIENISNPSLYSNMSHLFYSKFQDTISIAHDNGDADFNNQMSGNQMTADSSSMCLGKNPLTFYEPLPASLNGSGSSLNRVKKLLASIKASYDTIRPYQKGSVPSLPQPYKPSFFELKDIKGETLSSFLDDDYSIEKIKISQISDANQKTHNDHNVIRERVCMQSHHILDFERGEKVKEAKETAFPSKESCLHQHGEANII